MDEKSLELRGKRPNEVPIADNTGSINYTIAALRVQCFWRRIVAKRIVKNGCLRMWFLEKNAISIQMSWRSHNAKKQLSSRRKDAAVALLVKEQKLEETALEKFKESLLWRMTLCCDMATVIQKWWVHRLSLAIARQDSTGIEQMKVECFDPKAIQTVVRRNKEVERQRMEEHRISPVATMVIPSSVPLGCDKIPLGGVIRTAVRPPPSSGILNINLRKEERERKELTLLEADIFISNTRFGDQRFSLFKEKKQIENNSAIKIQSMFRRNIARDRMEAMVLERQDRYFKLCPTKFEGHPVETPI